MLTLWLWWAYSGLVGAAGIAMALDACFGLPKLANLARPRWDLWPEGSRPRLSVIVPARNEEERVGACLQSLIGQDYQDLEVIAVDDRSTDRTGEIMEQVAAGSGGRVRVVHVAELLPGWLGKTHAMWKAALQASGEWILFTDGDVLFRRDCIRRALAYAEHVRADHFVLIPTFLTASAGERMFIGVYQVFLVAGRPWKVSDRQSSAYFGSGCFNLVRRSVYEHVGTFEALRLEVVEDLSLAQRIKRAGFAARTAVGPGLVTVHWAKGVLGFIRGMAKNNYAFLRFRWYWAVASVALVLGVHTAPFVLVWTAPGLVRIGFAAWLMGVFYLYAALRHLNRISPTFFALHPIAAGLAAYGVARSAVITTLAGGVVWRGTKYPIAELRRSADPSKR